MSKIEKLKEKFFSKPIRNDITFDEMKRLAESYGCKVMSGSKHMHVVHAETGTIVPIPRHGSTIGEAYVKQLKDLFIAIDNQQEE